MLRPTQLMLADTTLKQPLTELAHLLAKGLYRLRNDGTIHAKIGFLAENRSKTVKTPCNPVEMERPWSLKADNVTAARENRMSQSRLPETPPSVLAQIAGLTEMNTNELKALWQQLFDQPPMTSGRRFLERRLAYQLQAQALAATTEGKTLLDHNQQRLQALVDRVEYEENAAKQKHILMPGTVLSRVYQGKEHTVTVMHDGQLSWEGRLYQSLSRIAREITGTRWSGPKFFGLPQAKRSKKKGRSRDEQ